MPLALGENAGFQFKTHPNIDKGRYGAEGVQTAFCYGQPFCDAKRETMPTSAYPYSPGAAAGVLGLKDASRAFPTNSSLGVLKWRFQTVCLQPDLPLSIAATVSC